MKLLITGGTGSLGHALVPYYLKRTDTERIIVFSRDELKQAHMREEFPDPRVEFFLGDVRDRRRLELAFGSGVDTIIHAAALKRIDSVAHDPDEVFKTNVMGSRNVLHAALHGIHLKPRRVLLVSSDKACYPTNAYGVSKAMAEHLFTSFNVYGYPQGIRTSVVRYGNVLGSRGSVLHTWRGQIQRGKPVTITDPGMTRFLITLPGAVLFIDTILQEMEGGEVFVPFLPVVNMLDLAGVLGATPPHQLIGLRPGGEKLHETLITSEELTHTDDRQTHAVVLPTMAPWRGEWKPNLPMGTGVSPYSSNHIPTMLIARLAHVVEGLT